MSDQTSPSETETAAAVGNFFEDIAMCLHHLSARVVWPGREEAAQVDFEERVARIQNIAHLAAAEFIGVAGGDVGHENEGPGTMSSD
jgi:hypothetical protein